MTLIDKLQAAEVGSRELDAEIAVTIGGFFIAKSSRGRDEPDYGYIDADGAPVLPGHGGTQMVPRYTASVDAALALADRVLPRWHWGLSRTGAHLLDEKDENGISIDMIAATPALALCAAILQAKDAGQAGGPS